MTGGVNGLFDDVDVLVVSQARRRRGVNGVVVDDGASLMVVAEVGAVDSAGFLVIVRLDTGPVLALGNVDDGVRVLVVTLGIELVTRLGVG